jgi:hypothetical protein
VQALQRPVQARLHRPLRHVQRLPDLLQRQVGKESQRNDPCSILGQPAQRLADLPPFPASLGCLLGPFARCGQGLSSAAQRRQRQELAPPALHDVINQDSQQPGAQRALTI